MRKIVATVGFAILALPTCAAAHGANPIPRAQIRLTTTAGYRVPDTELRAILSAQSSGSDPVARTGNPGRRERRPIRLVTTSGHVASTAAPRWTGIHSVTKANPHGERSRRGNRPAPFSGRSQA